jgi:cytochrome bd-type quinol oxidase subunit 2
MNAVLPPAALTPATSARTESSGLGIGLLRALLLGEAVLGLIIAIGLSMLASGQNAFLGGEAGRAAEQTLRFAAGFSFLFAIFAAFASRGARRRRTWSWTLAALLQLILAVGTGIAILTAAWHPAYLLGFALPAVVMLVLSASSVRRALGQE